jgi:pyruvate,orthophosphate dikinase
MIAARAVVTERGGATSHAAVVSRALGRPSVVGVGAGVTAGWGDREVTVDGRAGVVYAGRLATEDPDIADVAGLAELLAWLTERSPVAVVDDADGVLDLDAAGVGLDADARVDVDELVGRLRDAPAARGAVLATADGARAVLRSGLTTVVRAPGQHAVALLLRVVQVLNDEEQR